MQEFGVVYEGRGDPLQILQFEQIYRYSECPQILCVRIYDYRRGGHHLALKFKSDGDVVEDTGEEVAVAEDVGAGGEMTVTTALKEVLKKALIHNGIARGLRECARALDRREAHLCILSSSCTEPTYVRLITQLCVETNVHLINVPDSKQLGEWAGLCKVDSSGRPRKIVAASCVVVKNYGEPSAELDFILNNFKAT